MFGFFFLIHCMSRSQRKGFLVLWNCFDHWSLYPRSILCCPIRWSPQDPRLCECNLWISLTYICLARVRNSFIIQDHPANIFSLIWMSGPTMALLLGNLGLWQSHSNLPSQKGPQGSGYPFYFCEDLPNPLGSWCSLESCLASLLSHWPFMGDFQAAWTPHTEPALTHVPWLTQSSTNVFLLPSL